MPTLTHLPNRHTVIDRRDGEYICFPDVIRAADGSLVVAYNEADQHVTPSKRKLLVRRSSDNGYTWGEIIRVDVSRSHCPRLNLLDNGQLFMTSSSAYCHFSSDHGKTWDTHRVTGIPHDMLDRIIDLGDDGWLCTGHLHRGTYPHPAIRQAPAEQMMYRSEDQGMTWHPLSVIARERNLVLCEASVIRLPDGRLLSLMRENSFVYEPMYVCLSDDDGGTWSDPIPTPLIGHRPTIGLTGGDLLVTYRNVGPDMGTSAWLGSLDELTQDFQPHGRHPAEHNPLLTKEGLLVKNEAGKNEVVRYALRPMTDPRSAIATLEAVVRVDEAEENGCAMRLGCWWRITPQGITADEGEAFFPLATSGFNTIRLEYRHGVVTLFINGEECGSVSVDSDHADTRPILFGAPYPFENNRVHCIWKQVSLKIEEPRLERTYRWDWSHEDGLPDQWVQDNVLELQNDRHAAPPDFGYSGWAELEDGSFFCAYHHGGGTEEDYTPLFSSYVMGTHFSREDFD